MRTDDSHASTTSFFFSRIATFSRSIFAAARCYELILERTFRRKTFGKFLHKHGSCRELIADSKSDLEAARLLTLACAEDIDNLGARGARDKIALIKVTVPELAARVVDRAVQVSASPHTFYLVLMVFFLDDASWVR